ncbi:MAG: hypothetical protein EOO04_37700, partial [Chitinophagaceae bacterium]
PEGTESAILFFRMIQEIVNNIVKHANASLVRVNISGNKGKTIITISDNGKGYDVDSAHDGIGMRNLKERAMLAKADIEFLSSPTQGTTVKITTK